MVSLIKNELTKIFKKKAIYITFIITLAFIILCNIIIKVQENGSHYDTTAETKFYEEQLKQLNPEDSQNLEIYVMYQTELDTIKLVQTYGGYKSWQAQIIQNKIRSLIHQMNTYLYGKKDQKEYQNLKTQYELLINKLNTDDWHYFAEEELKQVQENLKQQRELKNQMHTSSELREIENTIKNLELEEQTIKWRLEKDISYAESYHNTCLIQYKASKIGIWEYENSSNSSNNSKEEYSKKRQYYNDLKTASISQYDIEHKTTAGKQANARGMLLESLSEYEIFIIVMTIMIAGSIVSDEFSKGTIKLLLIKPFKRSTILASKLISSFIVLLIVIIVILGMQFIVGGIVHGFDSFSIPAIVYNYDTNQLQEINTVSYLGMQILGKLPIFVLLMTLAFGVSTIFTNSALAITIGLLGYMGSPFVNQLGLAFNLTWLKFFVTPNWDLTQYFFGGLPEFQGLTPLFSIAVIIVYMLIMLVPTFIILKKKNIKNV